MDDRMADSQMLGEIEARGFDTGVKEGRKRFIDELCSLTIFQKIKRGIVFGGTETEIIFQLKDWKEIEDKINNEVQEWEKKNN